MVWYLSWKRRVGALNDEKLVFEYFDNSSKIVYKWLKPILK